MNNVMTDDVPLMLILCSSHEPHAQMFPKLLRNDLYFKSIVTCTLGLFSALLLTFIKVSES